MRPKIQALAILLAIFAPYFAFVIKVGLVTAKTGTPPPRWVALVGLIYMVSGIWAATVITRKMFNKQLNVLSPEDIERSNQAYGKANFPPLKIETAYISSVEHLTRFQSLPWYTKQLGIGIGDFPYVTFSTGRGRLRAPLVCFSIGELTLSPEELKFRARFPVMSLRSYSNLDTELYLTFKPRQILSVARFDMSQIASSAWRLRPFIRIQTSAQELRDFLVCSSPDDFSEARRETQNLFVALQSFAAAGKAALTPG
jgi:hypothetical protein